MVADEFVIANIKRVRKASIEGYYLKEQNYVGIVEIWKEYLLDKDSRERFMLVEEILGR